MTKRKVTIIEPRYQGSPIISNKPFRNTPCQCGSGKKQKHCCGDKTKYYCKPKKIKSL